MTLYTEARYVLQYGGRETRTGYAVSYNDAKSQGAVGCEGDCTVTWKPFLAAADARPGDSGNRSSAPMAPNSGHSRAARSIATSVTRRPGDVEGNNRHVIVYGGLRGQIVYSNPGTDPRDPAPRLGKLDMVAAVGPKGHYDDDDTPLPEPRPAADANAHSNAGTEVPRPAKTTSRLRRYDGRAGAGFYWHTASLFY